MDREDLTCASTCAAHAKRRLADPWLDLGVANNPFTVDMSVNYAALLPHFQDTVDSIRYFADSTDPLAVISGYPGVGKTTVVDALCQINDFPVCKISASSAFTQEHLLELLLEQCSIDVPQYGLSTSAKLTLFADAASAETQPRLCIIDDAHLLNTACIQLLLDLVSKQLGHSLFKIILVGRETLFERLMKQYSHMLTHVLPLHFIISALPEHQLTTYLHRCLARANWPGVLPEISEDTLKQIYSLSDGIPHRINLAADKVLSNALHANTNQQKAPLYYTGKVVNQQYSNRMMQLFLGLAYAVLLCGCFGWYNTVKLQQAANTRFTQVASIAPPAQVIPEPVQQAATHATPPPKRLVMAPSTGASVIKRTKTTEFLRDTKTLAQPDASANFGPVSPSSPTIEQRGFTPMPLPHSSTIPTGTRQPGGLHSNPIVQADVKPITQTAYTEDENKILQDSGYTLQIMASPHLSTIKQFQQGSRLGSDMLVYKTQRNNQVWYVLTYGQFTTYQAAKTAQAKVRSRYYLQHAWVKSLTTVHKEIQQV